MAENFDMRAHRDTWERFTKLATYGGAGKAPRPVLVNVWYPAVAADTPDVART